MNLGGRGTGARKRTDSARRASAALACAVGAKVRGQRECLPGGGHRALAGGEKGHHLGRHDLKREFARAALAALLQQRAIGGVEIDYEAVGDGAEAIAFWFILECGQAHW